MYVRHQVLSSSLKYTDLKFQFFSSVQIEFSIFYKELFGIKNSWFYHTESFVKYRQLNCTIKILIQSQIL